ncbi:MAG: hypothetical protein L6R36_007641 [Xanthoria steineri]|nr:MAG: hypothetical protein L6R36_007641 [Xanthoria steineri]
MPADTVNEVLEQEKPQTSDFEQRAMAYIANRKTARELSRTAGEATKGPIEDQRNGIDDSASEEDEDEDAFKLPGSHPIM